MDSDKRALAIRLYDDKTYAVDQMYKTMSISKPTLYKYIEAEQGGYIKTAYSILSSRA